MSFPNLRPIFKSSLLSASAALLALAMVVPQPALADISRSCRGTIDITVVGGGRSLSRQFTIPVTVSSRAFANRARERSRAAIISCVQEHWDMRMSDGRPHWCNNGGNYPFQAFSQEMTQAICAANPGRQSFNVNVSVSVSGNTGCVPNNRWAPISIARGYRVYCALPAEPETRQGWNLPRHDYRSFDLPRSATWQECAKSCAQDGRCQAWTYKHPDGGNPPLCFLKDGVPDWHRDNRFVSGIKGEVLH